MMRRLFVMCVLLSLSGGLLAAPAQESPQDKTATTTDAGNKASAAAGDTEKKLKPPTGEKQSVKTVINQAIKVFVPSEKIDVDKPVDFPTNI